jgi:hypothetical protein
MWSLTTLSLHLATALLAVHWGGAVAAAVRQHFTLSCSTAGWCAQAHAPPAPSASPAASSAMGWLTGGIGAFGDALSAAAAPFVWIRCCSGAIGTTVAGVGALVALLAVALVHPLLPGVAVASLVGWILRSELAEAAVRAPGALALWAACQAAAWVSMRLAARPLPNTTALFAQAKARAVARRGEGAGAAASDAEHDVGVAGWVWACVVAAQAAAACGLAGMLTGRDAAEVCRHLVRWLWALVVVVGRG